MGSKFIARPRICPEKNCNCIWSNYKKTNMVKDGYGFFCFGKMKDPTFQTYVCRGVPHMNDMFFCCWTPTKGWIKFNINENDVKAMKMGLAAVDKYSGVAPSDIMPAWFNQMTNTISGDGGLYVSEEVSARKT